MKNEDIKKEFDKLCDEIKTAKEQITELQNTCQHEDTYEGLCSYRVGSYYDGEICSYCGKIISDLMGSIKEQK